MENFIIEGTHIVPTINFDSDTGVLKINGRLISISGQEYQYFRPLIDWINKYSLEPAKKTNLDIDLEYCSSGGMKVIFQLFKILEKMYNDGNDVSIVWHYYIDDEDSEEKGSQFQRLFKLPFQVLAHSKD